MKKQAIKTYAFWIILTEVVGLLAGLLTKEATKAYSTTIVKPPLSPPGILFPIVWAILYLLMAIGAARVSLTGAAKARSDGLLLYSLQLIFNFFWSIIFFNFQAFGFAFVWLVILWVLILLMILTFRKADSLAAYLQIPYLVWVAFAGYLNVGVWMLNP